MEVKAHARFIRMSPRKVRLVVDAVRGMDVAPALTQLSFMNKAAAHPVKKLIDSAVANAEHNFGLSKDGLFIKAITADGGPTFHRWRPRAMGRATPIRKRTAHISVVLGVKEKDGKAGKEEGEDAPAKKAEPVKKAPAKKKADAKAGTEKAPAKKASAEKKQTATKS